MAEEVTTTGGHEPRLATEPPKLCAVSSILTPPAKKKRGKRRKRSPRPTRYRGRLKKPGVAAAQKALWADPEYREQMMEKRRAAGAAKRGFASRYGVPDGMRKAEADKLNNEAKESAAQTMAELDKAGVLDDADAQAREALKTTIEIMRKPGDKKVQLAAARQVLEWTKAKPAATSNVNVNAAEAWLKSIAEDKEDGAAEGGSEASA